MDYVEQKADRKQRRIGKNISNIKSIMQVHAEKMNYFENLQNVILVKKQKLLKNDKNNLDLQEEIDNIIERKEEIEYHLNTAHIISDFVDLENTSDEKSIFQETKILSEYNYKRNELIGDYFNAIREERPSLNIKEDRPTINICKHCIIEMIESSEGFVCIKCGFCDSSTYISNIPSYKDSQEYEKKIVIDYKRINYFAEWLNQIQAKEQTEIPEGLTDSLILEFNTEKITDMRKLDIIIMKRLLKKIGYSKFYEHIPLIIYNFSGIRPLTIPSSIENRLKFMFNEIQIPWETYKDKARKNFFSYPYILYKFFEILEMRDFLPYVTFLKSRDKLYKQDIVWKKVISELINDQKRGDTDKLYDIQWRFIPSV
jgi:hypothetical protein